MHLYVSSSRSLPPYRISDDLHEAKEALADANRKLHELDLENARLAGEIRELQTALKEADAARRDAENRAQRALAELQQLRIEMERRLQEKEEEMEALRFVPSSSPLLIRPTSFHLLSARTCSSRSTASPPRSPTPRPA